jgi:hypothetical protein
LVPLLFTCSFVLCFLFPCHSISPFYLLLHNDAHSHLQKTAHNQRNARVNSERGRDCITHSAWPQTLSQPEGRDLPIQSASLSVHFNHQLSVLQNHHAEYSFNQLSTHSALILTSIFPYVCAVLKEIPVKSRLLRTLLTPLASCWLLAS